MTKEVVTTVTIAQHTIGMSMTYGPGPHMSMTADGKYRIEQFCSSRWKKSSNRNYTFLGHVNHWKWPMKLASCQNRKTKLIVLDPIIKKSMQTYRIRRLNAQSCSPLQWNHHRFIRLIRGSIVVFRRHKVWSFLFTLKHTFFLTNN